MKAWEVWTPARPRLRGVHDLSPTLPFAHTQSRLSALRDACAAWSGRVRFTRPNDRVNPRFILTVNLDVELDRARAGRYLLSVRQNPAASPGHGTPASESPFIGSRLQDGSKWSLVR